MKQCDGQMDIFDIIGNTEQLNTDGWSENAMNPPIENGVKCTLAKECEAYPVGCGGTIEPCRFGGPYKWLKSKETPVCSYSGHTCNKEQIWLVAESLDDIKCPHTCCRKCGEGLCGARCNGAPTMY